MKLLNPNKLYRFLLFFVLVISMAPFLTPCDYEIDEHEYKTPNIESAPIEQASLDTAGKKVFWFIHVTDTQHLWYSDAKINAFKQFLAESRDVIKPEIIYNTGDLVDSDYEEFILPNERDQRIEEWQRYKAALDEAGMDASSYMDIIGNHDVYGDHGNPYFMNYSMMGSTYGTTQHAFKRSFSFGDYAFIGLHTAEDYGAEYPFGLFGHLTVNEMDWYEEQLDTYKDSNLIFSFGHHPPYEIDWTDRTTTGKTFLDLNRDHGTFLYLCGHGHINSFQKIDNMFAIETTKFDDDGGSYRIIGIDDDQLSTSLEFVGKWPQGMITNPPRDRYMTTSISEVSRIRALAWDPNGVNSVKWSAWIDDNTMLKNWADMTQVSINEPLWEANWDNLTTLLTDYQDVTSIKLKIEISGGSGTAIREIQYSPTKPFYFGWQQGIPIIIILFISLVSLITLRTYYLRTRVPKYKKNPEEIVDKKLRNLLLLKLAVFLFVPLTFAGMFIGKITAVFSFFFLNEFGLHFNGVNLLFTGVTLLLCFQLQPFRLSYKARNKFIVDSIISMAFLIFVLTFFILHFPALSWLAPGYYAMLSLDILMIKRSKDRNKEFELQGKSKI